jgi:hypothetical protein
MHMLFSADAHERLAQALLDASQDTKLPATQRFAYRIRAGQLRAHVERAQSFGAHHNSDSLPWRPLSVQSSQTTQSAPLTTKGAATSEVACTLDEKTWAQAKPMFIEAMQEFGLAAKDIGKFAIRLAGTLRDTYGFSRENFEAMKPYLMHFLEEVRDGTIKITAQIRS